MGILVKPHITEKTAAQTEKSNIVTFVVDKTANKIQIKNEVEEKYGVTVESVRTIRVPAKAKQRMTKAGILKGRTSLYKKAIIQVAEGDEIDFYSNV